MTTLDELLDAIERRAGRARGRGVLRLRRDGDRRLLGHGVLPPPAAQPRDSARSSSRARCSPSAQADRAAARTSSASSSIGARGVEGPARDELERARRAAVQARDRRRALHRRRGSSSRRTARGPPRRARLVGHALPGRAAGRASSASTTSCARAVEVARRHAHRPQLDGPVAVGRRQGGRRCATFAGEHELDLERSFAYANGDRGRPVPRSRSGRPAALNPEPGLRRRGRASAAGRSLASRAARAAPASRQVVRTVGFLRRAWPARLGRGVGRRPAQPLPRETASNLDRSASAPTSRLALAGVERRGRPASEHLWSARPAVFVFNHQCKLDAVVMMKLLRGDFTGVAKKEVGQRPGLRAVLRGSLDVAFIDRARLRADARGARAGRRQAAREGISLVIAPEGTRSTTPRARPLQEGRVPHRDAGGRADRPDRDPQRRRAAVARLAVHPLRRRWTSRCCRPIDIERLEPRDISTSTSRTCATCSVDTLASWPDGTERAGAAR